MPLTKYNVCEKEVSLDAKTCPHCGTSKPGESALKGAVSTIMGAIIVGLFFWFLLTDSPSDNLDLKNSFSIERSSYQGKWPLTIK